MAGDEASPRGADAEDSKKASPTLSGETARNPSAEAHSKPIHEESPLLSASRDEEDDGLILDNDEALVQPYVGILSDNCRSPWGKRTPFMIAGSAATIVSLLALAWAREIVGGFLGLFGADRASEGVKTSIIVFAVLWVYILDFAINTGKFFSLT
jgi:hypothetical protein